jgi:hypothetical protein
LHGREMNDLLAHTGKRSPYACRLTALSLMICCVMILAAAPSLAQNAASTIEPIPLTVWRTMNGKSWHADLPCPSREELVLLKVPYWDFDGVHRTGELIVARSEARNLAKVFDTIFASRQFRFAKMRLIDHYNGSDDASMADNNTSAFNCRKVEGGQGMSKHARGLAIDINPIQNPYRDSKGTYPRAGLRYGIPAERKPGITGLIVEGDIVTRAFADIGWSWGGNFKYIKDYQHFAK